MDEFELMAQVDEESASGQMKLNFGRITHTSKYKRWEDKKPTEVTLQQFLKLDKKERSQEVTFAVNIQEFKPDLQFTYDRRVNVGSLDWNKIFKPSLFRALGVKVAEGDSAAQLAAALKRLSGAYVAVEDVPAHPNKQEKEAGLTESKYNTIRIHAVYADKAACFAAWKSKYGGASNGASETGSRFTLGLPGDYPTVEAWEAQAPEALKAYNVAKGGRDKKLATVHVDYFGFGTPNSEGVPTLEQVVELLQV